MDTGIDVSGHNGSVDFKKVHAAGWDFAFTKSTEGQDWKDPTFTPARVKAIRDTGLRVGVYHFMRPKPGRKGSVEADHFIKTCEAAGVQKTDLWCLDVEVTNLGAADTHKYVGEAVTVLKAYLGRPPIIYTGPYFWNEKAGGGSSFGCPLWVAHYGVNTPMIPKGWTKASLWQYSSAGSVPGVSTKCDVNRALVPLSDLTGAKPVPKPLPRPSGVPSWLPSKYRDHWIRPWTRKAKYSPGFRRQLAKHALLTPHFSLAEAGCKDGTPVPKGMQYRARNHAFALERLRHELGDKPIPVISWYRTPAYNARIGGAKASRHMKADATDHSKAWVDSVGKDRVLKAANVIWKRGGIGTYPGGSLHFDSRGVFARWTSW